MTADRITALEEALNKINGITEASFPGATSAVDVAEIQRTARTALAASRAAPDCHQPDLVTAAQVRVKPLVWDEGEEPGEWKSGEYDIWCEFGKYQLYYWSIVHGNPHPTAEAAKAAAQADYEARIIAALDLTPAPAVEPRTVICGDASVAVCSICDIAGCKHVRGEAPAVEPVALTYMNWRGETSVRTIIPRGVWFGSTEWHPEPQWMLQAFDTEKGADRDFALKDFGSRTLTAQDAARVPEIAVLIKAAKALRADMLERAQMGLDVIHGEQYRIVEYRIVNAGRTAWADFDAALRAIGGDA